MLTRRATMWWMAFASSGNKISSYLWASVFLQTQQCWKVPATSQANPEWFCWVGLRRLIGGIPAPACCHWCHRCWNLQRALQADLLCRVKGGRHGCATEATFSLCLLKKDSLPPPKYHCKSILRQPGADTFFFSWGPETPLFFSTYIYIVLYLY